MKCICFNCCMLLCVRDEKFERITKIKSDKKRFNAIYRLCKEIKECKTISATKNASTSLPQYERKGCGFKQPKITKQTVNLEAEFSELPANQIDRKRILKPEEILAKFQKLSKEDIKLLGFNPELSNPCSMILQSIPVAPPQVRPSIAMSNINKQEDDLTYNYLDIIKKNNLLKSKIEQGQSEHVINEGLEMLQFSIAVVYDNDIPNCPQCKQRSGKATKSISARLKGKEGRIRGHLMGKRCDFSARTVITPDPNIMLDQLGVPKTIALNITIPETVTQLNKDELMRLVYNGPNVWPGAKYIIREDGTKIDLRFMKKRTDAHLEIGYSVERHIKDDDIILLNRQPSLHKMSIMGHRVKVLPYSSFRLNLSATTPYNADFDGDEMNMYCPQCYESKSEVKELIAIGRQIVTPQNNKPIMGIVQDSLVGSMLISVKDVFIDKDIFMNLVMWIDNWDGKLPQPAILKPKPLWTGKQLVSLLFPKVNLNRTNGLFKSGDPLHAGEIPIMDSMVLIKKGRLLKGVLCKRTVGNAAGGLVHIIWNDYGPEVCKKFLSNMQTLVNNWLIFAGFSVGISDTISDEKTLKEISDVLLKVKKDVKVEVIKAQKGELKGQPGKTILEAFESKVNFALNNARDKAGDLAVKSLSIFNNIKIMVQAGSKGSPLNISQIVACVGQQNVEGKRIPFGFKQRTLPHFWKDDYGPESRGFVENSYLSGLTPQEFFFHAMGGREGIIDTAVKTSETGYIQRRLIKALEDVMVQYDGTVRGSMGNIVQFLYGEDGIAGEYIEDQPIKAIEKSDNELEREYKFIKSNQSFQHKLPKYKQAIQEKILEDLINSTDQQIALNQHYENLKSYREELRFIFKTVNVQLHIPVNLPRIISDAKNKFGITHATVTDLSPIEVLEGIEQLLKKLTVVPGADAISMEAQSNCIKLFSMNLYFTLSPKKLLLEERINKAAFTQILGEIDSKFHKSMSHPGEMVGSIAAQSIGEPATQMTLNTFHFAGVSSKDVTLGVPRLKEIINVAKKMGSPQLTIYLREDLAIGKEEDSVGIRTKIEYTTLCHIALSSRIYYDPDPKDTIIAADKSLMESYFALPEEQHMSSWVLRIELNPNKMIDRKILMSEIVFKIKEIYENSLNIVNSDDNDSTQQVIRIRLINSANDSEPNFTSEQIIITLKDLEKSLLYDTPLKGISQIKKVYLEKKEKIIFKKETGVFARNKELVILTDGCNLSAVMPLEEIDFKRTYSNNISEMFSVLGIEAVRHSLMKELREVLDFYGIYVNYRHLSILCDVMTHMGYLTAITRHGINRMDTGPLRRCSFEETVDILMEAAAFSEKDPMKGVTENVMFGQMCTLGTGCFDILIDQSKLDSLNALSTLNVTGEEGIQTPHIQSPPNLQTPFASNTPAYGKIGTPGRDSDYKTTPSCDKPFTPDPYPDMRSPYPISPSYGKQPSLIPNSPYIKYNISSPRYNKESSNPQSESPSYLKSGNYPPIYSPNVIAHSPHSQLSTPQYSPSGETKDNKYYYNQAEANRGAISPMVYNSPQNQSSHSSPQYSPQQYTNPPRAELGGPLKYSISSPRYKPNSPSATLFVTAPKKQENVSPLSEGEEEEKKE